MAATNHPSMHHFASQDDYQAFVEDLAANETDAIEEWGAYEIATDVVAQVEDRRGDIEVGGGSVPDVDGVDEPLCPVTVLEYSTATSGLPEDEVESISHLAAELLEKDLDRQVAAQHGGAD